MVSNTIVYTFKTSAASTWHPRRCCSKRRSYWLGWKRSLFRGRFLNTKASDLKSILDETKSIRASSCPWSHSNESFLLMSANSQRNPRLWCHLILKVAMLYGVCNESLWSHAHTFYQVYVHVCMSASTCDWVIECVCTIHCSGLSDSLWICIDFLSSALFSSPSLQTYQPSSCSFSSGSVPAIAKHIVGLCSPIPLLSVYHKPYENKSALITTAYTKHLISKDLHVL